MGQKNWKGKKVLIIDQNAQEFKFISQLLAEEGFQCLYAADSATGIHVVEHLAPDIILMDWNVPDLGEYQIIERLKTAKGTRIIPIIMLIGSSISATKQRFEMCNEADDYAKKPITKSDLIGRIGSNLRLCRIIKIIQEREERLVELTHQLQEVKHRK